MSLLRFANRRLLALGLAGTIAIGAAGVAVAQVPGTHHDRGPGAGLRALAGPRAHLPHPGIREVAHASGLDLQVLLDGLKDGKSINTILTENGKDPGTVEAAVLADVKAKLDSAVSNGRITQEQADKAYAKAQEALPKLFERVPDPNRPHPRIAARVVGAVRGELKIAADTIGISPQDLAAAVRDGQTIAAVANAHNVAPQAVIDALVAPGNTRIDQAVANGKITDEQGAEAKTRLLNAITKLVQEGRPGR